MAQSGVGDIIKWGLLGLAGYWVYSNYFSTPAPAATTPTPTPTPTPAPNPNAIVGANTAAGVFAKLQSAAPAGNHNVDEWNVYLTSAMPSGFVAPDPMPLFTAAVPGFDRSQQISAAQYWGVMAPYLKTNAGLSGVHHFARLAGLYGRRALA